jgi:hypothetical protein
MGQSRSAGDSYVASEWLGMDRETSCPTVFLMCSGRLFQAAKTAINSGSIGAKNGQLERRKCSASAAHGVHPSSQVPDGKALRSDVSPGSSPVPSASRASVSAGFFRFSLGFCWSSSVACDSMRLVPVYGCRSGCYSTAGVSRFVLFAT